MSRLGGGVAKSIPVTVCTWDPSHTLARVEAQQRAVADGTIEKMVREHGRGTPELRAALVRAKLVSQQQSLHGDVYCPECGTLMDTVLGAPGIADKVEAIRDLAENEASFAKALTRTRQARG